MAGFGVIPKALREKIERLDKKFGKDDRGRDETDYYLWAPGCTVNVKVRGNDLKFKRRTGNSTFGLEEWLEDRNENFHFPHKPEAVTALRTVFGPAISFSEMALRSADQFLRYSAEGSLQIKVVTVRKQRIQYTTLGKSSKITVELAEIFRPLVITSIGVESKDAEGMAQFIADTGLPSYLVSMDYLKFIGEIAIESGRENDIRQHLLP